MKEVSSAVRIRINPATSLEGICFMPCGEIIVQNDRRYVTKRNIFVYLLASLFRTN